MFRTDCYYAVIHSQSLPPGKVGDLAGLGLGSHAYCRLPGQRSRKGTQETRIGLRLRPWGWKWRDGWGTPVEPEIDLRKKKQQREVENTSLLAPEVPVQSGQMDSRSPQTTLLPLPSGVHLGCTISGVAFVFISKNLFILIEDNTRLWLVFLPYINRGTGPQAYMYPLHPESSHSLLLTTHPFQVVAEHQLWVPSVTSNSCLCF